MIILGIIDENENIIGQDTRENIHKNGLLHREIHVWYYTPKGEIIFQLRGKNKDTFPGLLDATVGGHVEIGDNYENTAMKEVYEETGLKLRKSDLKLVMKLRKVAKDSTTGMTNNVIRTIFAYKYAGKTKDLKVEGNKAQGFEAWSLKRLINGLSDSEKKRFIPTLLGEEYLDIYRKVESILLQK